MFVFIWSRWDRITWMQSGEAYLAIFFDTMSFSCRDRSASWTSSPFFNTTKAYTPDNTERENWLTVISIHPRELHDVRNTFLLWMTLKKDFFAHLVLWCHASIQWQQTRPLQSIDSVTETTVRIISVLYGKRFSGLSFGKKRGEKTQMSLWLNIWRKGSKKALLMQLKLLKSCSKMSTILFIIVQYDLICDFIATFFKLFSHHAGSIRQFENFCFSVFQPG